MNTSALSSSKSAGLLLYRSTAGGVRAQAADAGSVITAEGRGLRHA